MRIKIFYETIGGTTQYVAEVLQRELSRQQHQVALHSLKYQGVMPDFANADVVLFGAPTYDDGLLEKTTRDWIANLHTDLSGKKVAVFGLGNQSYPQYCKSADLLEEWVRANNGQPIIEALRVDNFPDDLRLIIAWADQLNSVLKT